MHWSQQAPNKITSDPSAQCRNLIIFNSLEDDLVCGFRVPPTTYVYIIATHIHIGNSLYKIAYAVAAYSQ